MKYNGSASPVAREATLFVLPPVLVAAVTLLLGWYAWTLLLVVVTLYVLWFFRNPVRITPTRGDAIVAPADGRIVAAGIVACDQFDNGQALRIAIFMSLFNVHMNWAPADGEVESAEHFTGSFLNAMDDKSSEENERRVLRLRLDCGTRIVVKFVAGLVARRIVSPVEAGDRLTRGEKMGLIRFGSRAEVLLPSDSRLQVATGDHVRGGETILALLVRNPSVAVATPDAHGETAG